MFISILGGGSKSKIITYGNYIYDTPVFALPYLAIENPTERTVYF